MKTIDALFAVGFGLLLLTPPVSADLVLNHPVVAGGGVSRASQLWQDPGPNGNDLDGDAVCFADFTLPWQTTVDHIEWWGSGAYELGFQIEIWKQDPGTIAYQPVGVFYYGGDHTVRPEARFRVTPAEYSSTTEGTLTHFTLNLSSPIALAANSTNNPRWFICVIGLTAQAYYTFDWAQGSAEVPQTFQFIRGGYSGGGPLFRRLGDARALIVSGVVDTPPEVRILQVDSRTVEISWDAAKSGYQLLTSPTLPVVNWETVTQIPSLFNGRFVVTLPMETKGYFQLVK
jgi:hypothetical protein